MATRIVMPYISSIFFEGYLSYTYIALRFLCVMMTFWPFVFTTQHKILKRENSGYMPWRHVYGDSINQSRYIYMYVCVYLTYVHVNVFTSIHVSVKVTCGFPVYVSCDQWFYSLQVTWPIETNIHSLTYTHYVHQNILYIYIYIFSLFAIII